MRTYITLDGGTTNTRLSLVANGSILQTVKIPMGARACIDNAPALRGEIREAIRTLLSAHGLHESDVERVLASGMITCEFGLCHLPHVTSPAGLSELHDSMHEVVLSDITPIPFVFIRGVKSVGKDLCDTDMMRGEEAELMGILRNVGKKTLYVLPGSHSKLIETDTDGRIVRFSTMLTGEMIASLSQNTILKDAVDLSLADFDTDALLDGCRYAREKGINEALFKVRVFKNLFGATPAQAYGFFLGAILSAEIDAICASDASCAVIGGKAQIKRATAALLRAFAPEKNVCTVSDADVDASSARGVIRIYEYGK
ncbi:MAG: 2-dehydro-3-deoxygalactonokinase [Clostridia bacterium]|nr:2-dehydro-3-deoxygalactonokinase [Clostridia bacterium]